jgi:hypothetical protein
MWSEADYYEERESRLASPAEAVDEFARNIGGEYPDRAWLLHDWDVWVKNPAYVGPPVPHPESDWEGPYDEGAEAPGFDDPKAPEGAAEFDPGADYDDDIPF